VVRASFRVNRPATPRRSLSDHFEDAPMIGNAVSPLVAESPALAPAAAPPTSHGAPFALLCLGALGVVFGDIGTSPLYTLKECLHSSGHAVDIADLFGILSLIVWSLTAVVTVKYLTFIMKADNKGEGGIFALLALVPEKLRARSEGRAASGIALLVVIGAALLYGDGAITPAISVLSAIEGLAVARPALAPLVIPLTCVILFGLFLIQKRGTGTIGKLFGPVMLLWFGAIGLLGLWHIVHFPSVLRALSPLWAVRYFAAHGLRGGLILGSVVLAVTGGEALYADMGHFGRRPIRSVWLGFVMPALVLCYFGQGALILRNPAAVANPFFALVPAGACTLALVILSSAATVIASQALISGAFSLTRQAMLLGYFPRVTIKHTAHHTEGQIYIPEINWLLAVGCIVLVLTFRASDHLAAAYGIAVTGTMGITSVVYYIVARQTWGWSRAKAVPVLALFLAFDIPFFVSNLFKFLDGGYVPILIGISFIAAMLVWSKGRTLIVDRYTKRFPSFADAIPLIEAQLAARVPGTSVFLASSLDHMPPSLMRLVERGRALHQNIILLTVVYSDTEAAIAERDRVEMRELGHGFHRAVVRCGFMEQPSVHAILNRAAAERGVRFVDAEVTYYLGRETILATSTSRLNRFAESMFSYLQRNAVAADRNFGIPPQQIVEIGMQVVL
jgi:KUP system potassium uptake protein